MVPKSKKKFRVQVRVRGDVCVTVFVRLAASVRPRISVPCVGRCRTPIGKHA